MSGMYLTPVIKNIRILRLNAKYLPLLRANEFPTARSHIVARSFVGIPAHQSLRSAGFLLTTRQSGRISCSQMWSDSSTLSSRTSLRSFNAFRRFSSVIGFRFSFTKFKPIPVYGWYSPATRLRLIIFSQSAICFLSSSRLLGGKNVGRVLLTTLSNILGPVERVGLWPEDGRGSVALANDDEGECMGRDGVETDFGLGSEGESTLGFSCEARARASK